MDNQATSRVKDLLSKSDKIGVLVGKNPTLDQMAAALSLYAGLSSVGKQVSIASPTQPIVANSSLVGIDKVKTALSGDGGDLIVSFPYREGEIEKVSYTLENGYLNIVVKATDEGLSFEQQDVLFKRSGGIPSLLFIVGTPRLSDLGSLFDADAMKNTAIINIDIQNENQGFGDVVLVSPQASSISELIGNLLNALSVDIDQDIAQNLLSGIAFATNNFQDGNTSFLAFEIAAASMRKGAKRIQQKGESKPTEGERSPFGPFTMPQPRQQQPQQRQQPGQQQPKPQRPWEQKTEQPRVQARPVHAGQTTTQQPRPMQEVEHKEAKEEEQTPPDWLAPKVYRSSTLI